VWYKEECLNGDPKGLNPYDWDMYDVNEELLELCKGEGEGEGE